MKDRHSGFRRCVAIMVMAAGLGWAFAAEDAPGEKDKAAAKAPAGPDNTPHYVLNSGDRNPMLPPGAASKTGDEDVVRPPPRSGPLTVEEVVAGTRVMGVLLDSKGDNIAMVNGNPAKTGEAVKVKIGGRDAEIFVIRIQTTPLRVTLRYGDREFTRDVK